MNLLGWIIGIGIVGSLLRNSGDDNKSAKEELTRRADSSSEENPVARREDIQCEFLDGISREEFESIALKAGKKIKRLSNISVDGPLVYGTVQSQSGISEWTFTIDFNNYGHLTGRYWVYADNADSSIPYSIAKKIREAIKNHSPSPCAIENVDDNSQSTDNEGNIDSSNQVDDMEDFGSNNNSRERNSKGTYIPCTFSDGISKYDFQKIVKSTVKNHNSINDRVEEIKIFDAKIYILIRSHTGKSSWRFVLDFNDNGRLTGFYHCYTDNDQSQTATNIGEAIKQAILQKSVGLGDK